jgi:hypothetical protein
VIVENHDGGADIDLALGKENINRMGFFLLPLQSNYSQAARRRLLTNPSEPGKRETRLHNVEI